MIWFANDFAIAVFRHPVRYCHFQHHILVTANIPNTKVPDDTDFDTVAHKR